MRTGQPKIASGPITIYYHSEDRLESKTFSTRLEAKAFIAKLHKHRGKKQNKKET